MVFGLCAARKEEVELPKFLQQTTSIDVSSSALQSETNAHVSVKKQK